MLYLNRMPYVARCSLFAIGVMFVAATLSMFLGGCAGKLKLPDLGSVDDLIDTSKSSHEYKTQVKIEIKTDLESIPVVDMSPGIIMPPIIPLPTNTPFASPGDPTPVPTMIPTVKPTAPPLDPRPKPTRIPDPPPEETSMNVRVDGIPKMTEENKKTLNKQCLFCVKSGDHQLGIYQRYLTNPYNCDTCEWDARWVAEYFINGEQIEGLTWYDDWQPLPEGTAIFTVDWSDDNSILITCDGKSERLSIQHPDSFELSENCIGNPSDSTAEEITAKKSSLRDLIPGRSILGL